MLGLREEKQAADFYESGSRLSSYCKDCQRQASRRAYRQRRQDPAARARMRSVDRLRKRRERVRLAQLDPDRERRAGRARRAAVRRLIAAHESEYLSLLEQELVDQVVVREAGRLGDRTVRQRVERWEAAGWAERRRMLGYTWVLPTRAGLRLAGLELDPWTPAVDRLAHHHAAAVVRLHREPVPGRSGWVCERELWRRRGRASWHMADGALSAPVPAGWQGISEAWELVEVELTRKARPRVVAAVKTRPPHTAAITYYVPDALHGALSAPLASVVRELGGRPPVTVELLPQVPGVTYMVGGEAR